MSQRAASWRFRMLFWGWLFDRADRLWPRGKRIRNIFLSRINKLFDETVNEYV